MSTTSCGTGDSVRVSRTARISVVSSISPTAPSAPTPSKTRPAQESGPSPVQARKGPEAKSSSTRMIGVATGAVAAAAACRDSRGVAVMPDIRAPYRSDAA